VKVVPAAAVAIAIVVVAVAAVPVAALAAVREVTAVATPAAVADAEEGRISTQYPVVSSLKGRSDAALSIWDRLAACGAGSICIRVCLQAYRNFRKMVPALSR
jgi:hypothetical protein